MEQRGPRWESDYAEFAAAHSGKLRHRAYLECGDWQRADQALDRVLRALYLRWPQLGSEMPEEFVERRLHDEVRRLRPPAQVEVSEDDLAPVPTVEIAALIAHERRHRMQVRLVGATLSMVTLVAAGVGLAVLRPPPDGGPIPELNDCMSEVPRAGLPSSSLTISAQPSGTRPSDAQPSDAQPSGGQSAGAQSAGPQSGVDRLITVADLLPLPGSLALPADVVSTRVERMACALAEIFMRRVNPSALERVDLGLGVADVRPLWPQSDPVYGTALTTSVRLMTPSGISTATVTIAQTSFLPSTDHCARLAFCQLSTKGDKGQTIEQYGVRDSATGSAGFVLGEGASWWAMLVYTGYTLVSLTITNTPDVRAALPATQRASPLAPQAALFGADPRLALFDPPTSSESPSTAPISTGA